MKALSIQQPFAWLIANGYQDVENRSWPTGFRGRFLIHAGQKMYPKWDAGTARATQWLMNLQQDEPWTLNLFRRPGMPWPDLPTTFELGGIVGIATIIRCDRFSASRWFAGPFGFVIADAAPLPFTPCPGKLGFFDVPEDILRRLEPAIAAVRPTTFAQRVEAAEAAQERADVTLAETARIPT